MNLPAILKSLMILTLTCTLSAAAQDLRSVKQRMKERVDEIAELKTDHLIGEERNGFLAIIRLPQQGNKASGMTRQEIRELVEAENADRRTVYAELAKKLEASPKQVAKARARQIYDEAGPDVLLKTRDGNWVTKDELMEAAE